MVGYDLSHTEVINFIKAKIKLHVLQYHPPLAGIPNCTTPPSPPLHVYVNWGFANCYQLSASNNTMLMAACDIEAITCRSLFTVCITPSTGLPVTNHIEDTETGVPCYETVSDWVVTVGNWARPCMRYCDLTN
jgi:hypothetical protein